MSSDFKKGDKVKCTKDGKIVTGKVSSVEAAIGYKKSWPYNIIHIKTEKGIISAVEWDVTVDNG